MMSGKYINVCQHKKNYKIMKPFNKSSGSVSTGLRNSHDSLTRKLYEGRKLLILLTVLFPESRTLPGT